MGFPSEINPQAIRQVVRYVTGQDTDKGRIALAAFDVEGYILGKVFPDATYVSDGTLVACGPPCELSESDPVVAQIVSDLKESGLDWTAILTQLKTVLGPIVLEYLMKLLMK